MAADLQANLGSGRSRAALRVLLLQACALRLLMLLAFSTTPGQADLSDRLDPKPGDKATIKTHDSGPETLEIIKARGFIGELYTIRSKDGTPLSVYHIINPLADPSTLNRYPVLVAHGIVGDAAQMLSHSELARPRAPQVGQITVEPSDTCLALHLSNNNFDVWMMDARGTNLNNYKASYDLFPTEGQEFWNFSLDEQAQLDVPTVIDFVLEQAHEDKLHYIGFSESTFFMFALLSHKPEYTDKIASFVALAPVAYVEHISGSALAMFSSLALVPDRVNGNLAPKLYVGPTATVVRLACQNQLLIKTLCSTTLSSMGGVGTTRQSKGFYGTTFKSTSIKSAKQFLQLYVQNRLGMYDYGKQENMRVYGQPEAPRYDLSRVRLPYIVLFRGDRDLLSDPVDQQRLLRELGTKPYLDFHFTNYQHLDFLVSESIVRDINLPAVHAMFELLKLNAANSGDLNGIGSGILRDPLKASLAMRAQPDLISVPDGNRKTEIRSDLVHNLISGVEETVERHSGAPGAVGQQLADPSSVAGRSLKVLHKLGKRVDEFDSKVGRVAEMLNKDPTGVVS